MIAADMHAVDATIRSQLHSDVPLVSQIADYIISAGGKRIRPALVLLMANAWGYQGEDHFKLAAVVEFIHTATLLHDDVVDESELRRGRQTANAMFGNAASVLVGDFVYSRAFQMMVSVDSMRVMRILADATNVIAEGEVLQLVNQHDPDTSEARYLEVIEGKTAKMFEAAAECAAALAGGTHRVALARYARCLGTAFQIVDDMMDYTSDAHTMGKNTGDDLAEGKPTLPLIRALAVASESDAQTLRAAIQSGGRDQLPGVLAIIERTQALSYCAQRAREASDEAIAALQTLPPSPYREGLAQLAQLALGRTA
jgi:octaprenyl-diphosphate synthase